MIAATAVAQLRAKLVAEGGLLATLEAMALNAGIALPVITADQVVAAQIAPETAERGPLKYPVIYVYCEKVANTLKERFRTFSGYARLVVEARVSHERIEGVDPLLQCTVDAIASVVGNSRGDWGNGFFFSGAYEISYSGLKQGGKAYIRSAKVAVDVDVSKD